MRVCAWIHEHCCIGICMRRWHTFALNECSAAEGRPESDKIQQTDPHGDCSWGLPYPRTYEQLPELLLKSGDWGSFTFIMCDLMFLWRKLQCGNEIELLSLYEQAAVVLEAKVFCFCMHRLRTPPPNSSRATR